MTKYYFLRTVVLSLALFGCVVDGSTSAGASNMSQRAKKHKLEQDFVRAMFADGKIMSAKRKKRETERKRKLMDKLMEAAIPRHLANNNNDDADNEYSFEDAYEWMNPVYQQMIEDGVFDLTARSFKYSGCAAIKAFNPQRAAQNGNPMVVDTYAVFRLCPEDSCNKYSLTGCGKNYGEYVVEMSTYLEFMLEFYESHYGAYCEYCYPCDYIYQVQKRQTQGNCYESMNVQEYNQQQSMQQMAWEDYYQQNYGDMSAFNQAKQAYQQQMQEQMNSAYEEAQSEMYGQNNNNNDDNNGNSGNSNGGYYSNYMAYANAGSSSNGNGGNRKLDGGYYSNYVAYANGDDSNQNNNGGNAAYSNADYNANGNNGGQQQSQNMYSWLNSGQAAGQAYYNMMNQVVNDNQRYGYYNENGEYVDLCESNGYTDNDGREYDLTCDEYESKMMTCSDGSLCDPCEYQIDQTYMPCDEYVCKDYYTYCSDLYEPNYKTMYYDERNQQNNQNQYQQKYSQMYRNNYQNNANNQQAYSYYNVNGQNYQMQNQNQGQDYNPYQYYMDMYDQGGGQNGNAYQYYDYDYRQQQQENELYRFLECTEYVNEYGQQYFIGPHCGNDHYTISLGVFSDENCVDYLGETISLSKVLGYGYDDESFFHLPHECISCDGAQQFEDDEDRYNQMYMGQGIYGQYVEAPNEEFDDVVAMCAALFERSAQCNIHMTNYEMMAKYMVNLDVEFEQRYCNFIDNIVYGSYDEDGEIKLRADSFDLSDWRNPEQFKKLKMPAGQAVGLALSILLVVALSALAFITQRSLTRRSTPWRPKRLSDPSSIERRDSGIYTGRSRSGVGSGAVNPPLI